MLAFVCLQVRRYRAKDGDGEDSRFCMLAQWCACHCASGTSYSLKL